MSADYSFGLVVAIEADGSIVRPVERCGNKYDAAKLCKDYALRTPGTLYVAMECHEAYRSEPRVEKVWLDFPVEKTSVPASVHSPAASGDFTEDL